MNRNGRSFGSLGAGLAAISLVVGCGGEPAPESTVPATAPKTKLVASDGAATDSFGASVAISDDTVIVGAVFDDDLGTDSGSAYVFVQKTQGQWAQATKLSGSGIAGGDNFGFSVAISGDTAIVGAPYHNENGIPTGAAYIFVRNGETWTEEAKLVPSDAAADDQFGFAVSIDGDRVIVGAPGADPLAMDSGAAYAFERTAMGWTEQMKLLPSTPGKAGYFGVSVALSNMNALVGAWDDGSGTNAGAAYMYLTDGQSWLQQEKLVADDAAAGDIFGYAVALDGSTAIVSASGDDEMGVDAGSAYVFGEFSDKWIQQAKLVPSDGGANNVFGSSVAIWGDMATIGAYWDDDKGENSGSAYIYARQGDMWSQQKKYVPADGFAGQVFGSSVAMNASTAIVGAYGDKEKGADSGAVYLVSLTE